MRRTALAFALAAALAGPAHADDKAGRSADVLAAVEQGGLDPVAAADRLKDAPTAELAAVLARTRTTSVEERRAVLRAIKASVPDKSGRFEAPPRQQADAVRADDELDWLAELAELTEASPARAEVTTDVVILRALARSKRRDAAQVILDAGFAPDTMIYRDECGRLLRAMAPQSLPALTIASQSEDKPRARYATYQLERLDRQEPGKAMTATTADEDLRVAQLEAFGSSHHREAVATVLRFTDDPSTRVRAAARAAWLAYVTGPPPKPAPKKKLVMPGGKTADEATPLWLTYRELAAIELQRTAEEVLGEVFEDGETVDLAALSQQLFAHHDAERAKLAEAAFAVAKQKADGGDLGAAIAELDRLLATEGALPHATEAAAIYLAQARADEEAGKWDAAATGYGKAHGVDTKGAHAVDAEAGREYALGKALEAAGKDGSANFRRAVALKPDYAPAKAAAARAEPPAKKPWLLWSGIGVAALAAILLLLGLIASKTRRRG